MNYVTHHWTLDPMIVAMVLTIGAHELGLHRLAQHSRPERTRWRRRKSLFFYAGLLVLVLAIVSPVDYWAAKYFFVHMIEHIFIAFAAPILIVVSAPWTPLMFALPVNWRRKVGRFVFLSSRARSLRRIGRLIRGPWFAIISFNAAMLVWHIPSCFELAERNGFVHVWLMHGSFIVTGVLFWLQILPSSPMKPARGAAWQVGAILATNVIMTVQAISMSMLTTVSWYPSYSHIPGVTFSPFADQQLGAAILWICGDFWALPMLNMVLRRAIEQEGSFSNVIDRLTGRSSVMTLESFRPGRIVEVARGVDGEVAAEG